MSEIVSITKSFKEDLENALRTSCSFYTAAKMLLREKQIFKKKEKKLKH